MAFDLSFSEEFFSGDGETPTDMVEPSDKPTSVYQAALGIDEDERLEIANQVFGYDAQHAAFWVASEGFAGDVLAKVRETNTCTDLRSPVEVYIDKEGWYTLRVYDSREEAT
jgi:hypothetical protein